MILGTADKNFNYKDQGSCWKNYRRHTIASIISYPIISFILIGNEMIAKYYNDYPLYLRFISAVIEIVFLSNYTNWRPEKKIEEAILNNDSSKVIQIIGSSSWQANICSISGSTPLHWACNSSEDRLVLSLLELGANPNARSNKEETPAHWAVSKSSLIKLSYLIQYGANLNIQDEKGKTPLHWAVHFNSLPTVTFLVESGADRTICDEDGNTPLELSRSKIEWEDIYNYLNSLDSNQS